MTHELHYTTIKLYTKYTFLLKNAIFVKSLRSVSALVPPVPALVPAITEPRSLAGAVQRPYVSGEMVAANERPAARRTLMRPHARVDLAVARQVAVADERLVARRARVRAREHVRRLVLAQVARADERLAARGAQVRPLAAVRPLVDLQLARGAVRLAARRARVRTLARVRARVRLQAARLRERPAACRARVRLHTRVNAVVDGERATGETHGRTGGALPQAELSLPSDGVSSVAVRHPAVVVGDLHVDVL